MLSRFFLKVFLLSLFASQVIAAPKKQLPQAEFMAMATANALNSFKSVGDYITWLGMIGDKEDLEKVRAELVKFGVDLKAKFPKAMHKKDRVYFDKDNYIIYGKDSLTVNGKKVSLKKQSAHDSFIEICAQLGCKKTTADFSLFLKAHAYFAWGPALAGAAALGGLAYFFAPPGSAWKGAAAGFVLGGLFGNRQRYYDCNGGYNNGGYNNGGSYNGGSYNGGSYNGGSYNGGSYNGGSYNGGGNCNVSYDNGSCGYTQGNNNYGNREQIYGPTNQNQCNQVGYEINNTQSPLGYSGGTGSGYGTDDLGNDLGSAQPTSAGTKDGAAKRGTTSVPKK